MYIVQWQILSTQLELNATSFFFKGSFKGFQPTKFRLLFTPTVRAYCAKRVGHFIGES